ALDVAAAGLTGVVLLAAGVHEASRRRLEMGVATRIAASMGLLASVAILGTAAALVRLEDPDPIGRAATAIGALLVVWVPTYPDGVRIAKLARRTLVLAMVGGVVSLLGAAIIVGRNSSGADVIAVVVSIITLLVGAAAPMLEEPLRPMQGAWLDATDKARE